MKIRMGWGGGSHGLETNSRCGFFTPFLVSTRDLGHPPRGGESFEKSGQGLGQLMGNVNGIELPSRW